MSDLTKAPTTISNIGVAMFTVADQDAAIAFYTEKLGFELRSDTRVRRERRDAAGSRWRRPARPPAWRSTRRWAASPAAAAIGVETPDVLAEHARLSAIGGIDLDPEPMSSPGAPTLFMLRDPDGNHVAVVEAPPAS